jgi:mRNA interferase YafQ
MLTQNITNQFKRDFKREKAGRHADLNDVLTAVVELLLNEVPLPTVYHDHPLKGAWKGYRHCHLKPDLPEDRHGDRVDPPRLA